MANLKRRIAEKQKELKRLKRDLGRTNCKRIIQGIQGNIEVLKYEIHELGTTIRNKEEGL